MVFHFNVMKATPYFKNSFSEPSVSLFDFSSVSVVLENSSSACESSSISDLNYFVFTSLLGAVGIFGCNTKLCGDKGTNSGEFRETL